MPVAFAQPLADDCAREQAGHLQVLYDLTQVDEGRILDRSGWAGGIDLQLLDPDAIEVSAEGARTKRPTLIRSLEPATRLIEAVRRTETLTIEAWVKPERLDQTGPARMITVSRDGGARDFTLAQDGAKIDVRFRTTQTTTNGVPSLSSPNNSLAVEWTHVVYCRHRQEPARIYINGELQSEVVVGGSVSNWSPDYHLGLFNELSQDRSWLGAMRWVAIYNRHLDSSEVAEHHAAGPQWLPPSEVPQAEPASVAASVFHAKIAPLLVEHCLECHDTANSEGGLDLSRRVGVHAGGESGEELIGGGLESSKLWELIESDEMPLDRAPLSDEEKAVVREWIEAGADWPVELIEPRLYASQDGARQNWVRRLTKQEFIETVQATFGVDIAEEALRLLPTETRADGFANTAYNLTIDFGHIEAYTELAGIIVSRMDVKEFARRFTRSEKLTDDNMRDLVAKMGSVVLRGPLDGDEIASYRGISTTVASAGGDFEEAVGWTLQAMILSPRFVYRVETQTGTGEQRVLSPHELASRMSYLVWGGPPDAELLRAAAEGGLDDCEQVRAQTRRMLADPRARRRSEEFLTQWLNLNRLEHLQPNPEMFPDWDPRLAADMRRETIAYFHDVVWEQKRPLSDLLNAQVTFVTPRLAKHYRLPELPELEQAESDDTLVRVDVSEIPGRGGLLTQGGMLTIGGDNASMVTRGLFVLKDLLFSEVGDPPPGLDVTPVPPSPGQSHRDIAMQRIKNPSCGGCHARFEPLAFGLERFDGLGAYFEKDGFGNELGEDGEIVIPGVPEPVGYATTAELMDELAGSERVQQSLTRKLAQFALGRPLVARDLPALEKAYAEAAADGLTYPRLIEALVMSDLVQLTSTETLSDQ